MNIRAPFYLAAPFFNPAQVELVEKIETAFEVNHVPLFSPRKQDSNKKPELTDDDAALIFSNNIRGMVQCESMLCVIDWVLPPDQSVVLIGNASTPSGKNSVGPLRSPPLNIPDAGTCFEQGYFYAKGKKIFGFTVRDPGEKVNLMLTQSMHGVIYGVEMLHAFLNGGNFNTKYCKSAGWRHR